MFPYLFLSIFLILAALALLVMSRRKRKASGLPGGRIIYADTRAWGAVEEPLYDRQHGLAGRPDYLVRQGEQIIPVEVKSGQVSGAPYDGHIFQLAAYCCLVESVYGVRPPYGILHYPNRTYAIDYTPALEASLIELLEEMREMDRRKELDRSHDSPGRCRGCGYRSVCEQVLPPG
jgi:CRISPR-associated exonuclease Cas4